MHYKINRRDFFISITLGLGLLLGITLEVRSDPSWSSWSDLLNFAPSHETLSNARRDRARPPLEFDIQRISDAVKPEVNLDNFGVRITSFPTLNGKRLTDVELLSYVRRNLNSFFDPDVAQIRGHLADDAKEWDRSGAPLLGTMMVFDIKVSGLPVERGAVVVSQSTPRSWIFSPVKIGSIVIGTHPVAGNREFGIRPDGNASVLYVRAADRPYDNLPPSTTVFEGADALWSDFQRRVFQFVRANGGTADVLTPIKNRPAWDAVVAEGYADG
jgi:hypothetical protein